MAKCVFFDRVSLRIDSTEVTKFTARHDRLTSLLNFIQHFLLRSCCVHILSLATGVIQIATKELRYILGTYSTIQYSTVRHSTVQYSTVRYSTAQYGTVQYSIVQYSTVQYSTVQYNGSSGLIFMFNRRKAKVIYMIR